jgi:hypothetical protein
MYDHDECVVVAALATLEVILHAEDTCDLGESLWAICSDWTASGRLND